MVASAQTLSLADLESFDPYAPRKEPERDFRCPLPACQGKRRRNLSVNVRTGLWECHRCHAKGKLREFQEERPFPAYQRSRRARALRRFELPPAHADQDAPAGNDWRRRLRTVMPLPGTPGVD